MKGFVVIVLASVVVLAASQISIGDDSAESIAELAKRGAPIPAPRLPGFIRCFTTGCAPVGLPAYCGKGIIEVARKKCISGQIDATCCVPEQHQTPPHSPSGPSPPTDSSTGHNPTKGYWDKNHSGCSWTGCAPKGLAAFCPAATKESGTKQCSDPGRIDVKCCL